jgi:hypothetical protein
MFLELIGMLAVVLVVQELQTLVLVETVEVAVKVLVVLMV